ncbi:MAG TPA: bifunctional 5,10-methylenetetrahydrofolate dehydrogenase/5,10-methenyltetrahydrofolate cyclohydrolase [Myxococcota bacterium]|nr:bifunctional 5,10-methylenetetrahydrofolate dehydrogenase/5,10-methenyltetrahydrofolate cyclohydrolase [Myxococcota bacterium]
MTEVVSGKKLSEEILSDVRKRVSEYSTGVPCLCVVLVGEDPASQVYVRIKDKAARECGIESRQLRLPATTSEAELLRVVDGLNRDPSVHGILVQLPLPNGIDAARVSLALDPAKDVDGLHPISAGRLLANKSGFAPCTPLGCIYILDHHRVPIEGANAVVIGRSEIVGKPVSLLLLHRNATVTICHSRTRDLPEIARRADILVAALGKPKFVQGDWIKPGAAVIDVGVNRVDGKLIGDVDFAAANGRAGVLTPVPGGVGLLTVAMLLRNTLQAFEAQAAQRRT